MSNRINIFEQTKLFYEKIWDSEFDFKPHHISLYMFLLNQNNRSNWSEWFGVAFDTGMQGSCIGSKKTYYKCLTDLVDQGLIRYKKGVNELRSAKISLEVLKCTSGDTATTPQPIPLPIPLGVREKDFKTLRPIDLETKGHPLKKNINFERFWSEYGKKSDRSKCEAKFDKLSESEIDLIFKALPSYIEKTPDLTFRKNPLTWLNGKCWMDEEAQEQVSGNSKLDLFKEVKCTLIL